MFFFKHHKMAIKKAKVGLQLHFLKEGHRRMCHLAEELVSKSWLSAIINPLAGKTVVYALYGMCVLLFASFLKYLKQPSASAWGC